MPPTCVENAAETLLVAFPCTRVVFMFYVCAFFHKRRVPGFFVKNSKVLVGSSQLTRVVPSFDAKLFSSLRPWFRAHQILSGVKPVFETSVILTEVFKFSVNWLLLLQQIQKNLLSIHLKGLQLAFKTQENLPLGLLCALGSLFSDELVHFFANLD